MTTGESLSLGDLLRGHAWYCRESGSPFYADLMERMADDVDGGGPTRGLIEPDAHNPGAGYRLRVLAGVHRLALAGEVPELARRFPTTGGDGDAGAAWPVIRELLSGPHPIVADALTHPPQTNEVGRSATLVGGFLCCARERGLPLRVLELGSSAGLNLRFDQYWYEEGGAGFGDPASPVRFEGLWSGQPPPFAAPCVVAERSGCDRNPIDTSSEAGQLELLSYVWPGQAGRFELLRAALEVAKRDPLTVDRAEISGWLDGRLETPVPGRSTVVFHSVVWPYLSDDERFEVTEIIRGAGDRADDDAPLAWLRLEGEPQTPFTELRLTGWPGGDERLLATASWHVGPVNWLVD